MEILHRKEHTNGTTHSIRPARPITSFRAAARRAGEIIVAEFGDTIYDQSTREGNSQENEHDEISIACSIAAVDLNDFPWANGDIGVPE
jgi:hypothetical protein